MAELTVEEQRAALVDRVAEAIMWHLQPMAEDEIGRLGLNKEERAAYDTAGGFSEGSAAVQAIRRRKVAEAVLSLLSSGEAGVHLVTGRDLQESVGVVLGQLHEERAEVERLTGELARVREMAARGGHQVERWRGMAEAVVTDGLVRCLHRQRGIGDAGRCGECAGCAMRAAVAEVAP